MARVEPYPLTAAPVDVAVAVDERSIPVPGLIKRNALLLATAEVFVGTAQQMVPTLSSIIIASLLGSMTFAGVGSSLAGLCRALVSYPSGQLSDRVGRKPVLFLGLGLSLVGAVALGIVVPLASFPLFFGALLLFSLGTATSQQQRRVSAVDMFPPSRRAQGLGYVLTGSLVGAFGGPVLISAAEGLAQQRGWDPLGTPWLLIPIFIIPAFGLILLIQPDPRDIALHLGRFYPGLRSSVSVSTGTTSFAPIGSLARSYPQFVALVCMFMLYGNMSMLMSMAPLAMSHHGMALTEISLMVSIHIAGMYGMSAPLGRLADRIGRRWVLLMGIALSTIGTALGALTALYPTIVLGLFLIGLGWCCGNVATPAIIADTSPPAVRGRAMGLNLTLASLASVATPLLGGVLMEAFGPASLMVVSLVMLVPCLAAVLRLREIAPGHFDHAVAY